MSITIKKEFTNNHKKPDLTALVFGKIPPQALEFEEAVIGACLLEKSAYETALGILHTPECFYVDAHQKIWQAIVGCVQSGQPVDLLTVTEQLRKTNELELIGGPYTLTRLTMAVLSSAHIEVHARIIYEKYIQRELIRISGSIISDAYEDSTDVFELLERTETELSMVTRNIGGAGDTTVGRVFQDVLSELYTQQDNKSALTGIDTGLFDLNEITCGWQKTDLIIIAARPGKGKTALLLNLAVSACTSTTEKAKAKGVGILSLEMGVKPLVKRMVSTATAVPFEKVYSGNLTSSELLTISQYSNFFNTLPIRISDKTRNWIKLKAQVKKGVAKYGIQLLLIDYLQIIRTTRNKNDNREREVADITADCKELAKELDIPVILLSQLNRQVESRKSQEPTPADLRESGAIEQDADIIIFPWHDQNGSYLSIAKNRNGKTATGGDAIKVKFSGSYQKWVDFSNGTFDAAISKDNPRSGITNNYNLAGTNNTEDYGPF